MDCEFWQVYGLTETSGIGTTLAPEFHDPSKGKLRSCGQAYTGVDIRIVGQDGSECQLGDVGEIQIKSDVVLKGCLLYTSPSPRDATLSRMPSSA